MFPDNKLKIINKKIPYAYFDKDPFDHLTCKRMGKESLGFDESTPLTTVWKLEYIKSSREFIISNDLSYSTKIGDAPANVTVTKVSFDFDQNMQLTWGFSYEDAVNGSTSEFHWYDTSTGDFEVFTYGDSSMSVVLMDDRRGISDGLNDIVIFYTRTSDSKLCYRLQRDRFSTVYESMQLQPGEFIGKSGVTVDNRVRLDLLTEVK